MSKLSKGLFSDVGTAEGTEYLGSGPYLMQDSAQSGTSDGAVTTEPGVVIGISAPTTDAGGPVIGISAPATEDAVPAESAPAGDGTSFGDSLAGLGAWEDVTRLAVVDDNDQDTNQKGGGASFDPMAANSPGSPGQLLTLGTNPDGSHFFTGNRNVDATLIGSKWGTLNLTFSFPTNGSNYNGSVPVYPGVGNYHIVLGTQQQESARAAFAQISAVSGLTFTEITETDSVHANIRISQTADADVPSAFGTFPSEFKAAAGDIWFGRNNQPYYDMTGKGTWGFATMMHEIGHTMGLKHGMSDYTNLDLSSSFGTSPRYGSQSLTPDRDGQAWSLMTYTPAPFTNGNFAGEKVNQPQTYMQYDIAALQYLYGANFNTNNGDSVYTFSQTTGEMFINGVGQGAPAGNKIFITIWDGGGNDTIDASNYAGGVTIDLRPGEFSTVDQNQLVNHLAYQNLTALAPGNIAMSLLYNNDSRSLIENATGGVGNDIFVGNTANNILDGGAGSDSVIFTNPTGVNVTLNDTNTDVIVTHDGETDTLRSIENIGGTSGNDTITGNSQDNILTGGSGGTDVLSGLDGNDRLVGGGFTVTTNFLPGSPASQPDIVKPQATNNGSIATAVNTAGAYDIDANANITNATTIPHATINATATGGSLEYYRIDVTAAGAQAIFDIDGTGSLTDSIIELVDGAGNVLATNDTGPGDPGTTVNDDAYITYTFAAAGTYYIRVGRFISTSVAQPMLAGQTYTLNISLQGAAGATTFTVNNTSSLVADGGEGNDYLQGTVADDTLTGGNGNDTASFATAYNGGGAGTTGVTVDLNVQGVAQNTVGAGNDTLTGIENLVGSQYNDTLTGDGNDNFIEGGLGADTMVGGLGSDTASYAGAAGGVTVSLAAQGAGQNTVNAGTDTLSGFENLAGSAFNDTLTGDSNANTLSGGAGNDTLNPGANAGLTVDLLDGGLGTDTASFAGNAAGVTATLNGVADGTATIAGLAIGTLRSIENLTGSSNADILTGDANANVIEGGLGDDVLDGGLGVDTVAFSGSTAVTINLATLTAQTTGFGSDTITNFENVRTGSGADNVTGDGNDNTFFDGGGNDTYDGAGNSPGGDTVDYSASTSSVTVNLSTLTAQTVGTFGGSDTITNMENVVGAAAFANTLTGNTLANRLTGGAAADTIIGGAGSDTIFGGAGNDLLLGGTGSGTDDATSDTVEGGAGADFVSGGQGNDILRGGEGDDTLVGGAGNNLGQFFTGVDGGDDTYEGGDGSDRAIAVYDTRAGVGASTVGIAFDIGNLAGNSNITFNGAIVGSMTSIEFVTFRGTTVDDNVRGGGSLDSLTGGAGNDTLDGWLGNDLLSGGLGNDTLIGGEGLDTATYANSTAGVTVDLRIQGVAQNTGGEGVDTLIGIEYLIGSNFADTLRGDDNFNLITDTTISFIGQTDSFFGYGGNDSILVTRTQGATSTINMDGGDGDDFIELRSGTLSVAPAVNLDGLVASSTGASQTYMALGTTGSGAAANLDVVTVDGGAGNDRIVLSGVASATVNAGSGNDIVSISMRGAAGVNNYQLTLGTGADIVQLGVGSNAANSTDVAVSARTNRVTDFERGDAGDKFEMTNYLNFGLTGYTANSNPFTSGHMRLTQSGSDLLIQVDRDAGGATNSFVTVFAISNGYTGGFTAFNFDGFIGNLTLTGIGSLDETITGATGNDVLSGGDGNDVLIGLAGTDTLNGGNGDDSLTGGTGNDALNGGSGTDTANYSGPRSGYSFTYTTDPATGRVTSFASVTDTDASNGNDGADTLTSVEKLTFSDQTIDLTQLVQLFDSSNNLVGTYGTIQAAIDASSNGYTVRVAAGTYNENLNVNKDITIEGPNVGIAGNGARGAEATVNGLVSIVADGVTLNGLKITGAPLFGQDITAIFANNDNATLTNLVLDGPGNGYGIQTTYNGGVTGLVLSNSLVTEWGAGTYFNPTTGFTATGNSFTGNGNDLLGDGWVAGSFIDNNSFDNSVGSHIGYGTYLSVEDMRNFVGTNNTFTGTGSRAVGIFAYGDGTPGGQVVTGTEYADGFFGSEFVSGSGNDSTFQGLGGNDSHYGGAGNDSFDGGSGTDTSSYDGTATIAETATGWTVTTGTEGTDTLANVEIVDDGNGGVIRLVGHGGYATIQDAINASNNGDTIVVASGTWNEDLNVNKDVTIQGVNNHGIAGTAGRGAESVINGQINVSAAGATIDGFKLVGPSTGSLEDPVVQIDGNNVSLLNNVIDGSGSLAVMVGLVGGVDIGSNLLKGYDIGIYVAGGDTTGSIHNNRFQGDVGPGLTGMGNGVNSESSHVTILNNAFDEIYYGSLNIYPFGPDSVDLNSYIIGNTITNSGAERPVQIMPTNLTHNIIGTDHNESFDGETAAGSYGVTGAFSFDGRGGDDRAWGGGEGDTLSGGTGNDQLFGNGGNDTLDGGDNNDLVVGGTGNDTLRGGSGVDTLQGGDDDDNLDGGAGNDSLDGGNGNDTLHGGGGNDSLNGGAGTDTAVYDGTRGDYSITVVTGAGGRVVGFSAVSDNEPSNGNEGADSLTSVEVLQFSNRTLDTTMPVQLFDMNNQLIGTFTTIQAAIDSAQDNYTIRVAAGVFDEDLDIHVGVRIFGARTTAVTGRDAANGVGETTISGHAKITAEDNVTLTGLRFLNDGTTTGGGASNPTLQILTGGGTAGHLVSNSIFWSTLAGGANGVDDRAISAPAIADGQITLTGNLISGASQGLFGTASWGRGVWIDGGGTTFNASGNIIEWTRSAMVLDGAGGSFFIVNGNTFRNDGTAFSIATTENGFAPSSNNFSNVGDEYNFRNLSEDVVFDAGAATGTVTPVGNSNDVVVILGGSGNDTLTGTSGADYIDANNRPGNLTVADNDTLNGGGGDDIMFGRFGNDTLNGGSGNDQLDGGDGNDSLDGGADNDTLVGGQGTDTLVGGTGNDSLDGGSENDSLDGGDGDDALTGGTGNDTLTAGSGVDTLSGGDGDDSLDGGADNDTLTGGIGTDTLTGGAGDDSLDGGAGIDTAVVGSGATYTFNGTGWTVTSSDGTDTLANIEIVDEGASHTLLVGSGGFTTIQAAVNAAHDGDTILVATGTYIEQVVVNNLDNLTIRAADGASVTIQAPADLVETARSSSDREVHGVLTVLNGTNVTIDNIDINGDGRGNTVDEGGGAGQANFYGIFFRNASGSLLGVDITGIRDPYPGGTAAGGEPLVSGVQRGVGLVVDNDSLLAFTMTGGSISDFQKNATSFNRADLNVTGVTITGGGAQTVIAQNGIQVANSTGTISGNTITGIGYAGPANAYSGAVLAFGNTNLDITSNLISGSNDDSTAAKVVGIYIFSPGPNSGGSVTGNVISNVDTGIGVYGDITPNGILIENNDVINIDLTDPYAAGVDFEPNPALATPYDVDGSAGDDILIGGAGNDTLSGLGGNDRFTGNGGDDNLSGGADTDTAYYAGPRGGYDVGYVTDAGGHVIGFSYVNDINAGNGDEGDDTLSSIEKLSFNGVILDLAQPVQLFDGGGQLVGTFGTIQAAVNAASNGYSIVLAAGTYAELVDVNKDVTISGPNAGKTGTDVTRGAEAVVDGGFYIHADGVTLNGLKVLGGGILAGNPAGIYVESDNVTVTNIILEGDGTATPGILTPYNGGVTGLVLSRSLITGWDQGTYFNPSTGFTAADNSFDGNGNAIVGDDWDDATSISGNSFTNSVGSHIGYGVLDTVDDVGAYFGAGNTFGGTNRPTSIFAYGDGTAAAQTVYGTDLSNLMRGETAGEDYIFHGRDGDDRLVGNDGDDTLDGGTGNDTLIGGSGTDTITLSDSTFTISAVADADPSTPGNQPGWTITTASEGTDTISGVEIIDSGASGNVLLVGSGGFTTIQAAIDASSDGDTILVAAGTYNELINVNKDVTIAGSNSGIPATDPRNPEVIIKGAYISADGATLNGLTVLGGGMLAGNPAGIYVDADDVTVTNMILQGDGSAGTGILTPYNGGVTGLVLSDSVIADWTNGTYFNPTTQFTASGNSFDGNGVALTGDDWGAGTSIFDNVFTNSSFGHVGYGVLDAVENVGAYFGPDNDFDATGGRPIGIFAYGTGQDITATDYADYIADTTPGSGTTIHGEGGNDYIDAGSGDDTLDGCNGDDILVGGSGTDTAYYFDPITVANLAAVADADPETAGNQPGWTVTTSTEGTDQLSGIEIIDSAAGRILLVGSGGFGTIQEAINAADDGDTILVAAGTYDEDLVIDKGVTIRGAQADVAVGGRDAATGAGETTIIGHARVTATDNVTINGIRFLNDGSTSGGGKAIHFETGGGATGHLVTDSIFWSTLAGGANGVDDRAISIQVIADGLITITDNLISGTAHGQFSTASWGRGIWFDGGGGDLVATGNTIEWTRSGLNLDMSGDSTANVSDNNFRNLGTGIALGIDSDGLTVSDNDVTNVGDDFSFRNLTTNVTFNAETAVDALTPVGNANDYVVVLGGSGNDNLTGTSGADYIDANNSPSNPGAADADTLNGAGGDDILYGRAGDDNFTGGTGDDHLEGGDGFDTAVYSGNAADYTIGFVFDGSGNVIGYSAVEDNKASDGDDGADTLVSIEALMFADGLFNPNTKVHLYDASDTLVGSYLTIQAAINAASDNYTIRVDEGTFTEDLVIDKGVRILGVQADGAVAGRDAANGVGETTIVGHAVVTATDNVTLNGLRFLNDTGTTAPTVSITTGGGVTGHLVTDTIFWSTIAGGAGGVDDRAISISPIAAGLITITDNLISGTSHGQFGTASWGRGIWFDGGGVALAVSGNVIEWTRTGFNLDMSGTSTVNISSNVLRGLGTGISVGIDSDGLTVLGNTIERVNEEFNFRNLTTGVTFDAGAAVGTLVPVGDFNDPIVVLGGSGNDTFTGTAGVDVLDGNNSPTAPGAADADVLNGLGGNDVLFGRGGNDTLDGGTGDDSMTGGTGDDIYVVDTVGDSVTEAASEGTDEVRTTLASYTLATNLENLTGLGPNGQTLNGNASNNVIDGGLGADTMTGFTGDDTYVVDNVGDVVNENAGEGTDEIRTNLATFTLAALANIENLTGTNAAGQTLTGNGGINVITGAGGADTIDGGAGNDVMKGGGGNDLYFVDSSSDSIVELAGEGTDEVRTGVALYVLSANVENLTATSNVNHDFRGNAGNNVITGGTGNDFIRLQDGGNDTAVGGAGFDVFLFGATLTSADSVDGGTGIDQAVIQGDYSAGVTLSTSFVGIESFAILPGSDTRFGDPGTNSYDYNLTTVQANVAAGSTMVVDANRLRVGEDFTFNGSAETDGAFFIYGGGGVDNLLGGSGNDTFYFGENLQFGASDHVDGGAGGIDQLGLRGNYTITFGANQLVSIESMGLVSAQDTRFGGLGTFYNYNLTMNDGNVAAGVRMTVDAAPLRGGETLTFDGSAELDGSFRIFGGQGADTIKGSHGNDLITGLLGGDNLYGSGGNDTFIYRTFLDSTSANRDTIHDFSTGDLLNISQIDANTTLAGDQAFTFINSAAFSHTAGELRAVFDGSVWTVQGDINGDGVADLEFIVSSDHPLVGGDFAL